MKNVAALLKTDLHKVIAISLVLFVLRLTYIALGPIDLAPDEAHYWEWSRYLDWSYYSKPPIVAWLNAISTGVFGHTHVGVRFFACVAMGILSVLTFLMANDAAGRKAGWFGFALIVLTPEFAAGGLMMTPDIPSMTFWAVALYLLTKLDLSDKSQGLKAFAIIGVVVGLAGLSKYTTALFYPLFGLYLLVDKERRTWFLKPHIYVAGLISLFMQLPVFYWNFMNEWVGFQHVLWQNAPSTRHFGMKSFTNFLGGQLGVLSPVTFILLLCAWVSVAIGLVKSKVEKTEARRVMEMMWFMSAPIFFMFLMKSTTGKVQPNWPVLSIYGGFVMLAIWLGVASKAWQRTFMGGLVLSALVAFIGHDTNMVRKGVEAFGGNGAEVLPFKKDPLKPALGWRGLGDAVSALVESKLFTDDYYVLSSRYQTASQLSFYMEGNPKVLYVNLGHRRQNQYDYWPWPSEEELRTKPVIYVRSGKTIEPDIFNGFESCALLGEVASNRGTLLMRRASVYACFGFNGKLIRKMPERY